MIISGVDIGTLKEMADYMGLVLHNVRNEGKAIALVLRPKGERYRAMSPTGRRKWAVCWHGHRDFMRALFILNPNAKVKTALATYRGLEDFERSHEATHPDTREHSYERCDCETNLY